MKTQAKILPFPTAAPVYLAAGAIHNLLVALPAGTGYFLGVVLVVLLTGHLAQCKGSLARAVYPFVAHLTWGWHRCERVLARGQFCVDTLFERAYAWCLTELAAEPVRLGAEQREVQALDSSTSARWRAVKRLGAAGKGYWGGPGKRCGPTWWRPSIVWWWSGASAVGGCDARALGRVVKRRWRRYGPTYRRARVPRLVVVDAGIATASLNLVKHEVFKC